MVQVMVVYVGDLIMYCELGTLGTRGRGVDFPLVVALAGLVGVDGVDNGCVVVDDVVVAVLAAETPSFLSRIFSSHSSQPCLGLLRLRCW